MLGNNLIILEKILKILKAGPRRENSVLNNISMMNNDFQTNNIWTTPRTLTALSELVDESWR